MKTRKKKERKDRRRHNVFKYAYRSPVKSVKVGLWPIAAFQVDTLKKIFAIKLIFFALAMKKGCCPSSDNVHVDIGIYRAQRDRATLHVVEKFAKSLKIT